MNRACRSAAAGAAATFQQIAAAGFGSSETRSRPQRGRLLQISGPSDRTRAAVPLLKFDRPERGQHPVAPSPIGAVNVGTPRANLAQLQTSRQDRRREWHP